MISYSFDNKTHKVFRSIVIFADTFEEANSQLVKDVKLPSDWNLANEEAVDDDGTEYLKEHSKLKSK
jgi:hypothetical protein